MRTAVEGQPVGARVAMGSSATWTGQCHRYRPYEMPPIQQSGRTESARRRSEFPGATAAADQHRHGDREHRAKSPPTIAALLSGTTANATTQAIAARRRRRPGAQQRPAPAGRQSGPAATSASPAPARSPASMQHDREQAPMSSAWARVPCRSRPVGVGRVVEAGHEHDRAGRAGDAEGAEQAGPAAARRRQANAIRGQTR